MSVTGAQSFVRHFREAYQSASDADGAGLKDAWKGRSSKAWTVRMLDRKSESGVLVQAARSWADERMGRERYQCFFERRKIDLIIAAGGKPDLFETTPVLLVEHENGCDVEVEAWNVASWRAQLRVIVFYADPGDELNEKTKTIAAIYRRAEDLHGPDGELLLISAPWTFGDGLAWRYDIWNSGKFAGYMPPS